MSLKSTLEHILSSWSSAVKEQFSNHELARFFKDEFRNTVHDEVVSFNRDWKTKASVGAGNWANVPWLSILNPNITSTTQDGIYPVFLFCADGSGVYLSLAQGVTEPIERYGRKAAEENAQRIKESVLHEFPELHDWDNSVLNLKATTTLGKSYEKTNIAAKFYPAGSIPEENEIFEDLKKILAVYKRIESFPWGVEQVSGLSEGVDLPQKVQLPKPFLLLAGISGTGKSRFVREQADYHNLDRANYCLVAVRPDWHEPSDLLGYVTRLSGTASYVATDVLRFMVAAWKSLYISGLKLESSREQTTSLNGNIDQLESMAPYWLCLDEMNLAPVEQYFADYLSLIETRCWQYAEDGSFVYSCDALLKASVLSELDASAQQKLAASLGLGSVTQNETEHTLWQHFLAHGIAIPPNLLVAGTVNMDETTHGFSRKVIDRAMSFDFGEFFPNKFDDFYAGESSHVPLTFPRHSSGREAVSQADAQPSIEFLQAVNNVLKNSPFELAYRALNELLLAVYCHDNPEPGAELQAVWDDFLMQKVLPRIEGDADKLQGGSGDINLLTRLRDVLESQLADIWAAEKVRPDFYLRQGGQEIEVECRSRRKVEWMLDRLDSSGFTSFWP